MFIETLWVENSRSIQLFLSTTFREKVSNSIPILLRKSHFFSHAINPMTTRNYQDEMYFVRHSIMVSLSLFYSLLHSFETSIMMNIHVRIPLQALFHHDTHDRDYHYLVYSTNYVMFFKTHFFTSLPSAACGFSAVTCSSTYFDRSTEEMRVVSGVVKSVVRWVCGPCNCRGSIRRRESWERISVHARCRIKMRSLPLALLLLLMLLLLD